MSNELQKFVPQIVNGKGFTFHGKVSAVGWEEDGDLTYDQIAEDFAAIMRFDGVSNWIKGDILNRAERKYGETYTQMIDVTNHKIEHLQQCKWIAGALRTCTRVQVLSWTHHRYIAHLPEAEQRLWLADSADNEWSSRELLQALEEAGAKRKPLPQPQWEEKEEEIPFSDPPEEEDEPPYNGSVLYESSIPLFIPHEGRGISFSSDYDGDEWYTPQEYVDAAREVMGSIDLDPASCAEANEVIKALDYRTKQDDSLQDDWFGNVFLNPPYSQPAINNFIAKAIEQYEWGNISQAIVLANNCTDTGWFHLLAPRAPMCLTRGRISFWRPGLEVFATRQGQVFFYLGSNHDAFKRVFSRFGLIVACL